MDILLTLLGLFFVIIGLLGTIIPVIPGPPISWLGLLCIYSTQAIVNNASFLWITLGIALLVTILDFIIPVLGTKKFGGTKKGVWGSTIGLIIGIPIGPMGIIIGLFVGAFIGELSGDPKNIQKALSAATGSLIGFIFSTGLKLVTSGFYLYYFIELLWKNKANIFVI